MKKFISILIVAALPALAPIASIAQTYVRSGTDASLSSKVLLSASTTNLAMGNFQVGYGGNGTAAFDTVITAANTGTSNCVFAVSNSINPEVTGWVDTPTYVTNACSGTNTVRYHNVITTGQFRYVKLGQIVTTQTNNVTISAQFGQHRP